MSAISTDARELAEPVQVMNSDEKRRPAVPMLVVFGIPYDGFGVSYSCVQLADAMTRCGIALSIVTPRLNAGFGAPIKVVQALPLWARWPCPYRLARTLAPRRVREAVLRLASGKRFREGGIVYFWACEDIALTRALRAMGVTTVWEKTNCRRATAKQILDQAYARAGLEPAHGISAESASHEDAFLAEVDYVFSPSIPVNESLRDGGVQPDRILSSSYGWDPARFTRVRGGGESGQPTFAFVGSVCIRKGAHLLLNAWARSGVAGTLLLAGPVEPAVQRLCEAHLRRTDVVVLGFQANVEPVYRSADVLVFPTLEEGAPLVTYEAAGCGLAIITTRMGSAGLIVDGVNGVVLDPYDGEGWRQAIRDLADSPETRRRLGAAAQQSAGAFTWARAGEQRARLLRQALRR